LSAVFEVSWGVIDCRIVWVILGQVGPLPWLGPQTGEVLAGLGKQGYKHVMAVPLGFTSDHIETLYEIDHTYAEVAKQAGTLHMPPRRAGCVALAFAHVLRA